MPTIKNEDGSEREISMEEFMDMIGNGGQILGMQRVHTDATTGEELYSEDLPMDEDGNFDIFSGLFGSGLFGGSLFGEMSFEEIEEAANDGDDGAMEQLAMAYINGDYGVDEDPEKAYYWLVKCAEAGNSSAMFNLGLFSAKGYGTERDFEKAAEWMQKAADEGDEDAENCVEEYRKLADSVELANAGDAQAQADLAAGLMKIGGSLYQAGEGNDYEESVKWAEKAVEQGNADAYWILALAYHHGRGVRADVKKAIELYKQGAEAGNDACKHNLACEYLSGENIAKDAHKGFALIKEAAENGYGLAMRDLGRSYQFAIGTPGNMKKAVEWYEKALEVIDDPELAQKVMLFKDLADIDPDFDKDYPEDVDALLDSGTLDEDLCEQNVYDWTFVEGKTVKGNGWNIAVPDGYEIIEPKTTMLSGETRLFELVPSDYVNEEELENIPIMIMHGTEVNGEKLYDNCMVHPNARAGFFGFLCAEQAKNSSDYITIAGLDSTAWSDVGATIMIQDTSDVGTAFAYQIGVHNGKIFQMLRVQTQYITEEQKKKLDKSIINWLHTMKYDEPNKLCDTQTKIEKDELFKDLLEKGETKKFEEAVQQAVEEYNISINGKCAIVDFMEEHHLLNEKSAEYINKILVDAMVVREFYLEKADQLIKRLKNAGVSADVLRKMLLILHELDEDQSGFELGETRIDNQVPVRIAEIRKEWTEMETELNGGMSVDKILARKKEFEERKKQRNENSVYDEQAKTIKKNFYKDYNNTRDRFENNFDDIRNQMECQTFQGLWDSRLRNYYSKIRVQLKSMGGRIESIISNTLKSLDEIKDKVSPEEITSIIDSLEMAIRYVDNVIINDDSTDIPITYSWTDAFKATQQRMKYYREYAKKRQEEIRQRIEKEENEEKRFYEALEYGIDEADLDKYKSYIAAKSKMSQAKTTTEYKKVVDMFTKIAGYLDSDVLKSQCEKKYQELKVVEDAKSEYESAKTLWEYMHLELSDSKQNINSLISVRETCELDYTKQKELFGPEKKKIEEAGTKKLAVIESEISECEQQISENERQIKDSEIALSKAFALAFSKKKNLVQKIESLRTSIMTLEKKKEDLKREHTSLANETNIKIQSLEKKLKKSKDDYNSSKADETLLLERIEFLEKQEKLAKADLDEKEKEYKEILK